MNGGSIHIVEVRSPVVGEKLPRADVRLGWRCPLDARELETIASWARDRGDASIHLHGAAVAQLDAVLDAVPVVALDVDATRIEHKPRNAAQVRDLALRGLPRCLKDTIAAFAGVRTLRVDARGGEIDARAFEALPFLRGLSIASASLHGCAGIASSRALAVVELVRSRVDDLDALLCHPGIVALRLANVQLVTSLDALRGHGKLRWLVLESLLHLESLAPIETLSGLERLAIGGLWQFNVGDAAFIAQMRTLRELSLDIGGARKNVEITKLANLPEPPPFDVDDYTCVNANA